MKWNLTVVDSGSEPPLELDDLEHQCPGVPVSLVREKRPGLTRARLRGIKEASGELLVFVDDDNVLAPEYLFEVRRIADAYPLMGVFGPGKVVPEFEREPVPELAPLLPCLVIRDVAEATWSNVFGDSAAPYGAGMVVTRRVADAYVKFAEEKEGAMGLDRSGNNLMGGGDVLFSFVAVDLAMGKGLFPSLKLTHLISANRVDPKYLVDLAYGNGMSEALMEQVTGHRFPRPGFLWRLLDYGKLIRRGLWTAARARMRQHRGYRAKVRELGQEGFQ